MIKSALLENFVNPAAFKCQSTAKQLQRPGLNPLLFACSCLDSAISSDGDIYKNSTYSYDNLLARYDTVPKTINQKLNLLLAQQLFESIIYHPGQVIQIKNFVNNNPNAQIIFITNSRKKLYLQLLELIFTHFGINTQSIFDLLVCDQNKTLTIQHINQLLANNPNVNYHIATISVSNELCDTYSVEALNIFSIVNYMRLSKLTKNFGTVSFQLTQPINLKSYLTKENSSSEYLINHLSIEIIHKAMLSPIHLVAFVVSYCCNDVSGQTEIAIEDIIHLVTWLERSKIFFGTYTTISKLRYDMKNPVLYSLRKLSDDLILPDLSNINLNQAVVGIKKGHSNNLRRLAESVEIHITIECIICFALLKLYNFQNKCNVLKFDSDNKSQIEFDKEDVKRLTDEYKNKIDRSIPCTDPDNLFSLGLANLTHTKLVNVQEPTLQPRCRKKRTFFDEFDFSDSDEDDYYVSERTKRLYKTWIILSKKKKVIETINMLAMVASSILR